MEISRIVFYLLTLEKVNQIREKSQEEKEILQNGNSYDLKECTIMPTFNSVN